ncbi:Mitochondrial distribution and morphology protein 12 [Malassezia pachydermatis]|uniref:Mitochondrial distribution and morphology protein n=1 Tax=Malassezia pachydermatis TaxID=77020 RepID=A0A0M8MNH1_9BASI|nr:mitochondrial distribution and morphology protein [Malassezia pachydermatis]KOS15118.1 mitochondrial distribution and morphology protein [Malassezia pachydermatis]
MSVDLDWTTLSQPFAEGLCGRLNTLLAKMTLPSFLGPVHVEQMEFGTDVPDVQIVHIGEPWRAFRAASMRADTTASEEASFSARVPMRLRTFRQYDDEMPTSVAGNSEPGWDETSHLWSDTDSVGTMESHALGDEPETESSVPSWQMHISVQWPTSSFRLALTTSLRIRHSDDTVMSLPVSLMITGLELLAQVIVVIDGEQQCVHISLSEESDAPCAADGLRAVHDARIRSRHQGQRILPYFALESQVGEPSKHVLENVGKVERFLGDTVRQLLEDELVYPHFYTVYW